jgi:hypothetical protein
VPKYRVTHEDGNTTDVYAPDEALAKKQANHQEVTRTVIADRRGTPRRDPSMATAATKIKD